MKDLNENRDVELPQGTVDLVRELVPTVRGLLRRGLGDEFQKACVRIGGFQPFGGGLKASLVGALRIDVHAVIKLGGTDLELHRELMEAVNRVRPNTFPEVLDVVRLDNGRWLLLMGNLRKYTSLLDLIYRKGLPEKDIPGILDKVMDALLVVREAGERRKGRWPGIPVQKDPFTRRLRDKLNEVIKADPELKPILTQPGKVMGVPCPPVNELLKRAEKFMAERSRHVTPVLQHGDPHLGNIMVRPYGKGYAVKLIDPNPEVGFTDPLYDIGKLFHWAEPVGWAHVAPEVCRAEWRCAPVGWRLTADCQVPSNFCERHRAKLEAILRNAISRLVFDQTAAGDRGVPLAIAAAHIGMAALLKPEPQRSARRFTLAHTLWHLAMWHQY